MPLDLWNHNISIFSFIKLINFVNKITLVNELTENTGDDSIIIGMF